MPKQKFNSVDVAAEVAELRQKVVGSWLANIYDLDDKRTFLLKFTKSGGRTESGEGEKTVVLIESGSRFHTTSYVRERKAETPGKLNAKLRMHLKGKRLNAVCQLGRDRAVEFIFGADDTKHSLVLELYAQGNLVLLDKNDLILTLLRPVRDDDNGLIMLGNHAYDRSRFKGGNSLREVNVLDVEAALLTGDVPRDVVYATEQTVADDITVIDHPTTDGENNDGTARSALRTVNDTATDTATKKPNAKPKDASSSARSPRTLREALCRAFGFSPQTADYLAAKAGAKDGGLTKLPLSGDDDASVLVQNVAKALGELQDWLDGVKDGSIQPEGHAEETFLPEAVSPEDSSVDAVERKGTWVSESFSPFPFAASSEDDADTSSTATHRSYETENVRHKLDPRGFDSLVDEHFASIERAADQRARERALKNANKKADKVAKDQERRANDLRREELLQETRATLIEYNLEKVDAVIGAVNALLASGQSWDEIERFVEDERRNGNPVAGLVKNLDLKNNAVTVGLMNRLDDEEDDVSFETDDATNDDEADVSASSRRRRKASVAVTLDMSLSAYANAREHFERKKRHAAKLHKTENQSGRALESARRDSEARVKKAATQKNIGVGVVSLARTKEWFEKFHWFITPENCLVVSARDASQTNLLVKKYMGPHDAFVRADVAKAPATIVKAPRSALLSYYHEKEEKQNGKDSNEKNGTRNSVCLVPSLSLAHAGAACLCRSAAWDTRTVISAWWVKASDVRMTDERTGEALAPGVVWHVGSKRYLPPAPLVMGYAYTFLVKDEDDIKRHLADRTVRVMEETDGVVHEAEVRTSEETEETKEFLLVDGGVGSDGKNFSEEIPSETPRPASSALDAFLDGSVETGVVAVLDRPRPSETARDAEEDAEGSDDQNGEDAPGAETSPAPAGRGGKARVSAAERRAMKKAMKKGANGADSIGGVSFEGDREGRERHFEKDDKKPKKKPPKDDAESAKAQKKKPLPRGKSAKAKRAASKYAEQDDEDRELAMALLGVKISSKRSSKSGGAKDGGSPGAGTDDDDDDETKRAYDDGGDDAHTMTAAATAIAKRDDVVDDLVVAAESDASDDDDDEEHGDENVSFLERDLARTERVDWFTGAPFLQTEVTHAVALVAPWDALKNFFYKAKLTPGSQKKGKAAKQALEVVTKAPPAADVMRSEEGNEGNVGKDVSKPESRKEKAARAERDAFLKAKIAAAADGAAAGDGAMLMCGQGVKVSMPAGAAKAMNAAKKNGGKRG